MHYILGTHHTSMFIWNGVVWAKQNEGKSLLLFLCFNSQSKKMLRLKSYYREKAGIEKFVFLQTCYAQSEDSDDQGVVTSCRIASKYVAG